MFCEHALEHNAGDLVRDARGRVLCPACAQPCEACGRIWFRKALNAQGLCADCTRRSPVRGNAADAITMKREKTMDEQLNKTLARLRRKFGVSEPGAQEPDRDSGAESAIKPTRSIWPLDSAQDTAQALAARHGIDRERYRSSPWYRRQIDEHAPAYARAHRKEQKNGAES